LTASITTDVALPSQLLSNITQLPLPRPMSESPVSSPSTLPDTALIPQIQSRTRSTNFSVNDTLLTSPAHMHPTSSPGSCPKMVVDLQLSQNDPVQSESDKATDTSHIHEVRHRFPTVTSTSYSERCSPTVFESPSIFILFGLLGEIIDR
jgi:hypothetical protein